MTSPPDFTETTINTKTVLEGGIIRVERARVTLPDGKPARRDVVRHPGAAAIMAFVEEDKVLLVWQYRYPLGQHLWEIPAGKIDADEAPLCTAQRELLEETGYLAESWQSGPVIATCPGFCDEQIYLFIARHLRYDGLQPQAGEFLQARAFSLSDAVAMITTGQIRDAKTMSALLLFRSLVS